MMTGCHQSDLRSVGSHLPESTIKRCMYSKTHPSPKSPFCQQTNMYLHVYVSHFCIFNVYGTCMAVYPPPIMYLSVIYCYLAPGGGCDVLFSPCLSVCVCVCLSVCVCVRPIIWYFISRLLEEILI